MKKNLLPLLAVAFVVAVLATGVFYSLVVSRMTAGVSPSTATAEGAEKTPSGPAELADLGIPKGMRAISVQVGDSAGVLTLLKPGHKVDVQAVYSRGGQDLHLKTILENVAVQQVTLQPESAPGKPALPVVTLLATPAEADVLGLADAAARIRLTLRNPADKEKVGNSTVAFHSVVRAERKSSTRAASAAPASTAAPTGGCPPQSPLLEPMKQ